MPSQFGIGLISLNIVNLELILAAISIRGPVLTPSSVLTTLPSGTSTTVSGSNLTVANLPAARIIQVQQPTPSGAQVLSTGRITAMTLHPLVVNASNVSTANTVRGVSATTAKPSLTITHVGKVNRYCAYSKYNQIRHRV